MKSSNPKYNTVMIIDDNNIDVFITTQVLKNANFATNTVTFNCALEAFKYISNTEDETVLPEIIFLDLNLDGISGFDFLELYQTLPTYKKEKISVYMVSSTIDPKDLEKINQNINLKGFCEKYITKEFLNSIKLLQIQGFVMQLKES